MEPELGREGDGTGWEVGHLLFAWLLRLERIAINDFYDSKITYLR